MTAREKFIARLKELGLYGVWPTEDHVGKVMEDGSIVVLIHVETDPHDTYTEIHYPPFEEVWKNEVSKRRLKQEFYYSDDDHFVAELAYWLDIHNNGAKCPLSPVDLYWAGIDEVSAFDYEDDPEIELYGRKWQEVAGPFKPQDGVDWLVATLDGGALWMNNYDGNVVLVKPDGNFLISNI